MYPRSLSIARAAACLRHAVFTAYTAQPPLDAAAVVCRVVELPRRSYFEHKRLVDSSVGELSSSGLFVACAESLCVRAVTADCVCGPSAHMHACMVEINVV